MLMNDVDRRIFEAIKGKPGRKAREIADQLGIDRPRVNTALYGALKEAVCQDRQYRWHPREALRIDTTKPQRDAAETLLGKLSRYYLDCLSHDDLGGVSEFATSQYGNPEYVELSALPSNGDEDPFRSEGVRNLLNRTRRDRNRKIIYLG